MPLLWATVHVLANFFFFNDTATTEIYSLSLHDALPICWPASWAAPSATWWTACSTATWWTSWTSTGDRKSTRLNSSHLVISYAVFCLKKKKKVYLSAAHCYPSARQRLTDHRQTHPTHRA